MPDDIHYFDFKQEGIKESGRFEARKKELNDGSYKYICYYIWYDVEFIIDGKKQTRELRVIGTHHTRPISFINGKYVTPIDPSPDLSEIEVPVNIAYSAKEARLLLHPSARFDGEKNNGFFYYYFVLDGVKKEIVAKEAELFVAISKTAIDNRYKHN